MISINDWSSPGCGGLCEYGYFHEEFPEFISVQQLDINYLELLTIVVVLKMWGHLWEGLRLTVWCDNAVAATALNSGRCQDDFLNSYLCEIGFLTATQKFEFRVVHLPGVLNSEADLFCTRMCPPTSTCCSFCANFLFQVRQSFLMECFVFFYCKFARIICIAKGLEVHALFCL